MNKSELQQQDREHLLHPFTDFHELGEQGTRVITGAEGVYITDIDGHKMLDGMSGLWCCNLGYSRREISDAIYEQLNTLPFYNSFFQCTTVPSIELADALAAVAPAHMNNVFFTGSGSEANDTNLRIIRRYWDLMERPEKRIVISRKNAYHGSTIGGASLGGMSGMHKQFQALDYIEHIQQPYWFGEGGDMSPEEFGVYAARCLDEKIQELGPENVAAFIAEPIQGAGGVIIPPETYWPEVKKVLDQYGDILLVIDEVIFGFGRTGEWFGADYYGMQPDLMTFAKAVTNGYFPLGGTMVGDRVAEVIKAKGGEFTHGYTYSAHPAACKAGLATINILRNEKIIENVRENTAPYLAKRWAELADHPIVGEARSLGLVGALELVKDKSSRARFDDKCTAGGVCRDLSIKNGLVMRATGDTMIIAPPLILTKEQVDELVEKARRALDDTAKALA
ncbi:aspartate aminotransferase family protein [Microbulbifer thermotolerans]|uniref:aspartate aminotransferase family protein n=1 Tax=Microbulbifer thermotolerans TaxID=252514 RepID=UPI00224A69FB|nr:aspartate aminotransferase family protein [Microbulbifer thermotolerans]MCX2842146.1 aspartate aminotransferase family protein [Microbulbifer thermotolerans]